MSVNSSNLNELEFDIGCNFSDTPAYGVCLIVEFVQCHLHTYLQTIVLQMTIAAGRMRLYAIVWGFLALATKCATLYEAVSASPGRVV